MITSLLFLSLSILPLFAIGTETVVTLTDAELQELLQFVFNQLNGSTLISITLLESLGLNTASVISLLQNIGYTILW
jgi:hypothetical protein